MDNPLSLEDITKNIEVMRKLYDIVRIVDPVKKEELVFNDSGMHKANGAAACYSFWNTGNVCENCISLRAYNENNTYVKLEYNGERVFMIMAVPFVLTDRKVIVEMVKDITERGIAQSTEGENSIEVYKLFRDKNLEVVTDELTKAYNRRYINEMLSYKLVDCSVNKRHITVMMADIDFFKSVNDNYGHLAGDFVLIEFVKLIKASIREGIDWVARYGGEEFLIFLENANMEKSVEIAEKLRKKVQEHSFSFEKNDIRITSSFGVYTIFCKEVKVDELISAADKNLYTAKQTGRNKVVATMDL